MKLTRHSLREDSERVLRAKIVSGELAAGDLYSVGTIADELQVSITPVREALLDLAKDGLIEMVRNRGFRIRTLSESELDHIIEIRLMLEPSGTRTIAERGLITDFAPLRRLAEVCGTDAARGDWVGFLANDRDLHMQLLAALDNPRLLEIVGRLRDQTRLYGLGEVFGTPAFERSTLEHHAILDVVESGDGEAAERLMVQHLKHARGIWAGHVEAGR